MKYHYFVSYSYLSGPSGNRYYGFANMEVTLDSLITSIEQIRKIESSLRPNSYLISFQLLRTEDE